MLLLFKLFLWVGKSAAGPSRTAPLGSVVSTHAGLVTRVLWWGHLWAAVVEAPDKVHQALHHYLQWFHHSLKVLPWWSWAICLNKMLCHFNVHRKLPANDHDVRTSFIIICNVDHLWFIKVTSHKGTNANKWMNIQTEKGVQIYPLHVINTATLLLTYCRGGMGWAEYDTILTHMHKNVWGWFLC